MENVTLENTFESPLASRSLHFKDTEMARHGDGAKWRMPMRWQSRLASYYDSQAPAEQTHA